MSVPANNSVKLCDFMYNLEDATFPTITIINAIRGIIAVLRQTNKLITKANKEQTPIMCKLTLKFKKVRIKASIEAIKPPRKKKQSAGNSSIKPLNGNNRNKKVGCKSVGYQIFFLNKDN